MKKLLIFLTVVTITMSWVLSVAAFEEVGDRPSKHPQVEVWLNKHNGSVYEPGQYIRVYFQTSEDGYVAIYNVDAEGFIHVLYPKYDDRAWVEAGRIYEIPDPYDDYDLVVDGPKGIEYVVAIASQFPLNLRAIYDIEEGLENNIYWPMGRITGDPHLAIHEINQRLAWGDDEYEPEGYSSDVSWFYVRQWVPYPRYIVYQWYPEYIYDPWWDPYVHAHIWIDFYWDHYWCRSWWWCRSCQPTYVYWYIDRDTGRRVTWKGHYYTDRRKPDWYREKPVRREGGGDRPSRYDDTKPTWEDRRRSPWGEPGTDVDVIKERASGKESANLERKDREPSRSDEGTIMKAQTKPRKTSHPIEGDQKSSRRAETQIRSSEPSTNTRSQESTRSRSTPTSETRKMKKDTGRGSTFGKIIGSVSKIFTGDSKKEKSNSSKESESSNSKSNRSQSNSSSSQSSKRSSNTEKKSR